MTDNCNHLALLRGSTSDIVRAMVAANTVNPNQIADTIKTVFDALKATSLDLVAPAAPETAHREAAVTARKSLANPDHIISMIDGKPYKTLRRHLSTHGMTPESYRAEFGLPASYPMVAPTYSESRRAMAKKIGLGRKPASIPPRAA